MELHKLPKLKGKNKKSKRIGRGYGSGKGGHTIGRGTKGQKSRGTSKVPQGFEGGQVPLYKKLPQIGGFRNPNSKYKAAVTLSKLNVFKEGSEVTPDKVVEKNIHDGSAKHGIKILANGDITKKLTIKGFSVSKAAREKIEKAGGKIVE